MGHPNRSSDPGRTAGGRAARYICQDLSAPPDYIVGPANALNITGQVVGLGGFFADPLLVHRAFLKNYGQTMLDLGTLGGTRPKLGASTKAAKSRVSPMTLRVN